MAKVILHPIGTGVEEAVGTEPYAANLEHMRELDGTLSERRDEVRAGWGPKYVERVHAKGKMTTWERIDRQKLKELKSLVARL